MRQYTVFGFYEDNNQRAGFALAAKNPDDAERKAIKEGKRNGGDFVPVVVLEGIAEGVDRKPYIKGGK